MTTPISANHWTPAQLQLMSWLALPPGQRRPRMQRDLAVELGVHETTLPDWKKLPGFGAEVMRLARELVRSTDVVAIVHTQVLRAKQGDLGAARFVLDYVGGMEGDQPVDQTPVQAQATALAVSLSVAVSGPDVDKQAAERAASRQLLERFTVQPE